MPPVDLRALVKQPIALTGSFDKPKVSHSLHEGISRDRKYTSPSASPISLPGGGKGLQRLKLALQEPISGMDAQRSHEAYVKLLTRAFSVHTEPGRVRIGPDGTILSDAERARSRSVLLAGVFRDSEERFEKDIFLSPRFAGVGVLAVLPNASDPKQYDDAWLRIEWVHSTTSMLHSLGRVEGLRIETPSPNRRIEILVDPNLAGMSPTLQADIERAARLLGVNPQVHVVTAANRGIVAAKVKASNPFELIVLGSDVHESVVAEFTRRHGERDLHRAGVTTADDALRWLLDSLPHIMGVGPGLMSQPQVEAEPGRPRMPVRAPTKCIHHGANTYVLDETTDEWWTRDFAQHGHEAKSIFKTYTLGDGRFHWQSDRDALGDVIEDKHKGSVLITFKASDTYACSRPESHLR